MNRLPVNVKGWLADCAQEALDTCAPDDSNLKHHTACAITAMRRRAHWPVFASQPINSADLTDRVNRHITEINKLVSDSAAVGPVWYVAMGVTRINTISRHNDTDRIKSARSYLRSAGLPNDRIKVHRARWILREWLHQYDVLDVLEADTRKAVLALILKSETVFARDVLLQTLGAP